MTATPSSPSCCCRQSSCLARLPVPRAPLPWRGLCMVPFHELLLACCCGLSPLRSMAAPSPHGPSQRLWQSATILLIYLLLDCLPLESPLVRGSTSVFLSRCVAGTYPVIRSVFNTQASGVGDSSGVWMDRDVPRRTAHQAPPRGLCGALGGL